MPISIGANISSLSAQRRLAESSKLRESTFERLSSGLRINHASDDAAGLSIAETLRSNSRVYGQALRNVNDGISALNIAQGALTELNNISQRQLEIAEQAANGVYSAAQRASMSQEANALVEEYNRIVATTEFNGTKLIDASLNELRIQSGFGIDGSIAFGIGDQLARNLNTTGTFLPVTSFATTGSEAMIMSGDMNNDGKQDIVRITGNGIGSIHLGNGNGTFSYSRSFNASNSVLASGAFLADLDRDGNLDVVMGTTSGSNGIRISFGDGAGAIRSTGSVSGLVNAYSITSGDFNGDGIIDLAGAQQSGSDQRAIWLGNGNGTFLAPRSINHVNSPGPGSISAGDLNNDGYDDLYSSGIGGWYANIHYGGQGGTMSTGVQLGQFGWGWDSAIEDIDLDGNRDIVALTQSGILTVTLGNGNGTFKAVTSMQVGGGSSSDFELGDLNGDGYTDIVADDRANNTTRVFFGNGNGSFRAPVSTPTGTLNHTLVLADFNGDGALDVGTGASAARFDILLTDPTKVTTIGRLNMVNQKNAREAINTIRDTMQRISSELGALGSTQSRFEVAARNVLSMKENSEVAAARIREADIAQESAQLVRTGILQQTATAVLAQANQGPALALTLLGR